MYVGGAPVTPQETPARVLGAAVALGAALPTPASAGFGHRPRSVRPVGCRLLARHGSNPVPMKIFVLVRRVCGNFAETCAKDA